MPFSWILPAILRKRVDAQPTAAQQAVPTPPRANMGSTKRHRVSNPGPPRECVICCDESPAQDFLRITASCKHEGVVCRTCVRKHIDAEVREKGRAGALLLCPVSACRASLEASDVERFLGKGNVEVARYERLVLEKMMESLPEFRWCPAPGCGSGQLIDGVEDATWWRCAACSARACVRHRAVFHEGLTCREYEEKMEASNDAEAKSMATLQREGGKQCPKCGHGVMLNGGCDHFTCRCKHQFCFRCLVDYDLIRAKGNHAHKKNCRHYRRYRE